MGKLDSDRLLLRCLQGVVVSAPFSYLVVSNDERLSALELRFVGCSVVPASSLALTGGSCEDSYLVDPASSHMLVSKIKPCMSKYKHL